MPAKPTWHPWIPSSHFAPGGLADGLMGAWFALEGAGTLAHDLSRRGNHGALKDGAGWAASHPGPVLDFDGSTNHAEIPHSSLISPGSGDFAVSVGLKTSFTGGDRIIIDKGGSGTVNRYAMATLASGSSITIRIIIDRLLDGTVNINDGAFHNVLMHRQGSTIALFVDGNEDVSGSITPDPINNTTPLVIAERADLTDTNNLDMEFSHLLYYDRALPAPDIRKLHADPYALLRPVRRWWAVTLEVEAPPPIITAGSVVELTDAAAYEVELTDAAAYKVKLTDAPAYEVELEDALE